MTILSDRIKEVLDRRCAEANWQAGYAYCRRFPSKKTCPECWLHDEEALEIARAVEEVEVL